MMLPSQLIATVFVAYYSDPLISCAVAPVIAIRDVPHSRPHERRYPNGDTEYL